LLSRIAVFVVFCFPFFGLQILNRRFRGDEVGTIEMRSGETRDLVLPNGQVVTLTPTLRTETPEEIAGAMEPRGRDLEDAWRFYRRRCGEGGC